MSASLAQGSLRSSSLGFFETIGQSIANISPTFTPALNVVAVAALAGQASWLVYGLAAAALLFVGLNIAELSGRFAAAGSFFIFISRGLGPLAGGAAGWALVAAYLGTAIGVLAGEAIFVNNATEPLGFHVPPVITYVVSVALVWYFAFRDIRLSSRLSVSIEAVSMVIIAALLIAALTHHPHNLIDRRQLALQNASGKGIAEAIVLGIFSFVGFESAATLGKESRNPLKTIPRAVLSSMIVAGIFFMFVAYAMVIAFNGHAGKLGNDASPLLTILSSLGAARFATFIYIIATISAFACVLASANASARLLFSMGRYQFVHRSMGLVHAGHRTPHAAIAAGCAITLAVPLIMYGEGTMNTFDWCSTFATFGFITTYLLISIAAPVYLRKIGQASSYHIIIGALGAVSMVGAFIGSVYPVPPYPLNLLPYIFLLFMAAGGAWLLRLKTRAPQVLKLIERDLESGESEIIGRK